ncbi:hypothetical protein, partial [Marinomonas lutimaris]|uniref:hypothetical protein n=1 Tax=Marinomonas lutimaris TaxID=2846746 RepID=UPI001CA5776C
SKKNSIPKNMVITTMTLMVRSFNAKLYQIGMTSWQCRISRVLSKKGKSKTEPNMAVLNKETGNRLIKMSSVCVKCGSLK